MSLPMPSFQKTTAKVDVDFVGDKKQGIRMTASWNTFLTALTDDLMDICYVALWYVDIDRGNNNKFKMSNDICCIITIRTRDYDYLTSRFAAYQIYASQTKQIQISLLLNSPQSSKKHPEHTKRQSRKCQNSILRYTDGNQSHYLMGGAGYDEKFVYEANYTRMDSGFKDIIRDWSVFSEMKEMYSKKIDIQMYTWKKAFEIEFIHGEKQQVLMIMRDCTSCNFVDKNIYADREYWRNKINNHFKDMFAMLANNYYDGNPHDQPNQNPSNNNTGQMHPVRNKSSQFEERNRWYVEKLLRFVGRQGHKSPQFWIVRTAGIVQFAMKGYLAREDARQSG